MDEDNKKIIAEEGMHTVCNGTGVLLAILRRDPVSKKHLVYLVQEATSADIAEKLIKNDTENTKK